MTAEVHVPDVVPPAPMPGLLAHRGAELMTRQNLLTLPTPEGTDTHRPVPHAALVQSLIEALAFRSLEVVEDQYALTPDGMRLFGTLALNVEHSGTRIVIGVRNSHDKSFAIGLTVGYKVFVCDNLAFHGDFEALSKKHSKHVNIQDVMTLAVDRMQRNFAPMMKQVDAWRGFTLPDPTAKLVIYEAFIAGRLQAPQHLARVVAEHYFEPELDDFKPRTMWSLSNAFTSSFKELDPVPRMRTTAKLNPFLAEWNA
jgi:hypothetical protein